MNKSKYVKPLPSNLSKYYCNYYKHNKIKNWSFIYVAVNKTILKSQSISPATFDSNQNGLSCQYFLEVPNIIGSPDMGACK